MDLNPNELRQKVFDFLEAGGEREAIKALSECEIGFVELTHPPGVILIEARCPRHWYEVLNWENDDTYNAIIHAFNAISRKAYKIGAIYDPDIQAKYDSLRKNSETRVSVSQPMEKGPFPVELEPFTATLARMFAAEGSAREVAILASAEPKIIVARYEDYLEGGDYIYRLVLQLEVSLYAIVADFRETCEQMILERAQALLIPYPDHHFEQVSITPLIKGETDWREKAQAWVKGIGVNNQGRVRSENVASKECDGLLFRSNEEINLYKALKSLGVSFAPLPVFLRGGSTYRRIEPDFVIIKDGIVLVVEVDGDTVHRETPAEADNRTLMLEDEGAHILHVKGSECGTPELAMECAMGLLKTLNKRKSSR